MYNFTFGTYNGLFVECDVPAVLPNDLSYFDFRRSNRRAIPDDNSPNVVIRKIFSEVDENAAELLLVALIYKAQEGEREGFIGFGSILAHGKNRDEIKIALHNAIKLANKSNEIFSEGKILSRPKANSTEKIDLRELPIQGEVECFGQIRDSLSGSNTIDTLSGVAEQLYEKMNSFEIVINENNGLNIDEIAPFLREQVNKQRSNKKRKELLRQKEINEEKLKNFGNTGSKNSNIAVRIAVSLAALSTVCGVAIVLFYLLSPGSEKNQSEIAERPLVETNLPEKDTEAEIITDNGIDDGNDISTRSEKLKGITNEINACNFTFNAEKQEPFFSSNIEYLHSRLDKTDNCIEVGISAADFLNIKREPGSYARYIAQSYEDLGSIELKSSEYHLISFSAFLDSFDETSSRFNWLMDENNENKYGLAVTQSTKISNSMFCTPDTLEFATDTDRFKMFLASQSNADFKLIIEAMAESFGARFRGVWEQLETEISSNPDIDYEDQNIQQIRTFIVDEIYPLEISNFDPTSDVEEIQNACFLAFTSADQEYLSKKSNLREIEITDYFESHSGLKKIRETADITADITISEDISYCMGLPEYIMVWSVDEPFSQKYLLRQVETDFLFSDGFEKTILNFQAKAVNYTEPLEKIKFPKVELLKKTYEELFRVFSIEEISPFSEELIPIDQICGGSDEMI